MSSETEVEKPDCPECGGLMNSDGVRQWRCPNKQCGRTLKKNAKSRVVRINKEEEELNKYGYDVDKAIARAEFIREKYEAGHRNFIVVSAQNNTGVFQAFFQSIKTYCKHNKAQLIVIASHYKNTDAWSKGEEKSWVDDVQPYIIHGDLELGNIVIKANFKINATSLHPLNGKQAHGQGKWAIFGHPQHAMLPVATPGDMYPLRLYSTGSCTKANYSISDIGERAKFNHVFGALVVNFRGHQYPFIRQINADGNGAFYDLDKRYTSSKVTKGHRIECLTPGDEHVKFNAVKQVTYLDKKSIVNVLRPRRIFRHDILDGYAGSHHHDNNDLIRFKKFHKKDDNYRDELDEVVDFINETTPVGSINYIVASNHDDHLDKWLKKVDPREDPRNALLIHELKYKQYKNVLKGLTTNPLEIYLIPRLKVNCNFLSRNRAFLVDEVDMSQHGDVGTNGSRGSASALSKTAFKSTIGHSHSARIVQGVYQAGTSTNRLNYENGLGDHSITHVIQYKGGKRTLIDIYDDEWF